MSTQSKTTVRALEHSPSVWEAQRLRIAKLYRYENRKLDDVRHIMLVEHGFHASERQYKRKLKAWGLGKNSKGIEKSQALTILRSSDTSLDMASVYKVNGKDIAAHKLLRYARSHGCKLPNTVRSVATRRYRATEPSSIDVIASRAVTPNIDPGNKKNTMNDVEIYSFISAMCIEGLKEVALNDLLACRQPHSKRSGVVKTILLITQVTVVLFYECTLKSNIGAGTNSPDSEYLIRKQAMVYATKYLEDDECTKKEFLVAFGVSLKDVHSSIPRFLPRIRDTLKAPLMDRRASDALLFVLAELREVLLAASVVLPHMTELPNMPQNDDHTSLSAVSDTKIHGVLPSGPHKVQELDIPEISNPVVRSILNPDAYADANSEPQRDVGSSLVEIPSNNLHHLEFMPTSVSDSLLQTQTIRFDQSIDNNAFMSINTSEFDLIDLRPRSRESLQWNLEGLTATVPGPVFYPLNAPLYWKATDWPDSQEGPISDLETYLDPSLWNGCEYSPRLDWNTVPLLEQGDTIETSVERE